MGIFGDFIGGIQGQVQKNKRLKAMEENFVRTNRGSEAICAYIKQLFDKDGPGYDWLKKNKLSPMMSTPLYPIVGEDYVSLCYTKYGNGRSFSNSIPKDVEVKRFSFQEMYEWYGLTSVVGYSSLNSKFKRKILESMITDKVQELPHIKYNGGFVVKMFG